jgi:glucose-1-phosphate thymidylyltransferase
MPVAIAKDAQIKNSIVGPYVTVSAGSKIENIIISDSVIGKNSSLKNLVLKDTIMGDNTQAIGKTRGLNIGDSSIVHLD